MNIVLEEIYRSTVKLLVPLTPEETYARIVDEAKRLAKAEYGSIFLYKHEEFERVYSSIPSEFQITPRSKEGLTYRALMEQKPLVFTADEVNKLRPEAPTAKSKLYIFIPLTFNDEAIGVLTLQSQASTRFTRRQLQTIKLFSSVASLKIRNVLLFTDIKKAIDTREMFMSMAAHELRTPLTAITGYSDLLSQRVKSGEKINHEWVEALRVETQRLSRLVNELSEINMIKMNDMPYSLQPCDVRQMLSSAQEEVSEVYPEYAFTIVDATSEEPMFVHGDFKKLKQVFAHIMHNAAKFSKREDEITIILSKKDMVVTIEIIDRGEGMTGEELKNLFSEFYKANSRAHEGIGLGLYISRRIIESHNGKIAITSKKKKGTNVIITLPQHV
jgi:two-component system, sensor histidine kinase